MMHKIQHFNSIAQLFAWIVCCCLIVNSIFFANSPSWGIVLEIGLVIQLLGILINFIGGRFNRIWLLFISPAILVLLLLELESGDLVNTHLFDGMQTLILSILAVNVLYFFTIVQVLKEVKYYKIRFINK